MNLSLIEAQMPDWDKRWPTSDPERGNAYLLIVDWEPEPYEDYSTPEEIFFDKQSLKNRMIKNWALSGGECYQMVCEIPISGDVR